MYPRRLLKGPILTAPEVCLPPGLPPLSLAAAFQSLLKVSISLLKPYVSPLLKVLSGVCFHSSFIPSPG